MSIHRDMRYRMTQRFELARYKLLRWNHLEISDIFRQIERVDVDIVDSK